jgi:CarD family transcriptional regulator
MRFEIGERVVHPIHGAGIVESVEKKEYRGIEDIYYRIRLLGPVSTSVMLPESVADEVGVRRAVSGDELKAVWQRLSSQPEELPGNHKKRYAVLEDKLETADPCQIAEVIRDMAWRQKEEGKLNTVGRRHYQNGLRFLAGEVAAIEDIEVEHAEAKILEAVSDLDGHDNGSS